MTSRPPIVTPGDIELALAHVRPENIVPHSDAPLHGLLEEAAEIGVHVAGVRVTRMTIEVTGRRAVVAICRYLETEVRDDRLIGSYDGVEVEVVEVHE